MKKSGIKKAVVLGAALLAALTVQGQGIVQFANTSSTLIYTNGWAVPRGVMSGAQEFRFGLYVGRWGSTSGELILVGIATNAPISGRFNGGTAFALPNGYPGGDQPGAFPIAFQIRAWSLAAGNSHEAAWANWRPGFGLGVSALGFVMPGGGLVQPSALFGTGAGQVGGFDIFFVPEPSTIALLLSGFVLLAFMRHRGSRRARAGMTKGVLLFAVWLAVPAVRGQGTVVFANTSTTLVTTNNLMGGRGLMSGQDQFRFGLYVGPAGSSTNQLTLVGLATNAPIPGRFSGGTSFTLPNGYPGGDQPGAAPIVFQIRAWSLVAGNSWEEAMVYPIGGIGAGASAIGQVTPGGGLLPAVALFGTGPGQVGGFDISFVPEPSTIALLFSGFVLLAFMRHRGSRRTRAGMTKGVLLFTVWLAVPAVRGQGTVVFANTSTTLVTTNNLAGGFGLMSGLNQFRL